MQGKVHVEPGQGAAQQSGQVIEEEEKRQRCGRALSILGLYCMNSQGYACRRASTLERHPATAAAEDKVNATCQAD